MTKYPILLLSFLLMIPYPVAETQTSPDAVVRLSLTGDWSVRVEYQNHRVELTVDPAELVVVEAEKHDRLPLYETLGTWNAECVPERIRGPEYTPTTFALDDDSVIVRGGESRDSETFVRGRDFEVMPVWGAIGRKTSGHIRENQPVWFSYRFGEMRLDSIVLTADGKILLRKGTPHITIPVPPELCDGDKRLANLWVKARIEKLEPQLLFPIEEIVWPEPETRDGETIAETLLPNTMAKLRNGESLRILAWGDSVTEAVYIADKSQRWQERFVLQLQSRFPEAKIELDTEGWGGRTTTAYLAEPPDSERNYQKKVLDRQPDLIVMEFVNDAGLPLDTLETVYAGLLNDFRRRNIEWVILTPHYVRPDWMGLDREREIDEDPRPYVKFVRRFAGENNVAVADAAARYGRLWRQGIPYSTLMSNNINHPKAEAMQIFSDALMAIFP
ncbi:MAG: SGNH/GDSL hydrolase family protein [Planctomycetaceae bacterium]|nr:SGNH/GDSL hydrolase family protein [Planctomycetaceae bacterium]